MQVPPALSLRVRRLPQGRAQAPAGERKRRPSVRMSSVSGGQAAHLAGRGGTDAMSENQTQGTTEAAAGGNRQPLLRLTGIKKHFPITQGIIFQREIGRVHAVDGVDLQVLPGETLGVVGETGCGKSTLGRVMCR